MECVGDARDAADCVGNVNWNVNWKALCLA